MLYKKNIMCYRKIYKFHKITVYKNVWLLENSSNEAPPLILTVTWTKADCTNSNDPPCKILMNCSKIVLHIPMSRLFVKVENAL